MIYLAAFLPFIDLSKKPEALLSLESMWLKEIFMKIPIENLVEELLKYMSLKGVDQRGLSRSCILLVVLF